MLLQYTHRFLFFLLLITTVQLDCGPTAFFIYGVTNDSKFHNKVGHAIFILLCTIEQSYVKATTKERFLSGSSASKKKLHTNLHRVKKASVNHLVVHGFLFVARWFHHTCRSPVRSSLDITAGLVGQAR